MENEQSPHIEIRYPDSINVSGNAIDPVSLPLDSEQCINATNDTSITHLAKRLVQSSVIFTEVGPFNAPLRYVFVGAAAVYTSKNPVAIASAYGGSTFLLEGAAAWATAEVLSTGRANKVLNVVNKVLDNKKVAKLIPSQSKVPPIGEGLIGLYAGTSALLTVKKRENTDRTNKELRRHGIKAAALISGVCAVQAYTVSEGLTNISDPRIAIPAILSLGALQLGINKAKRRVIKKNEVN